MPASGSFLTRNGDKLFLVIAIIFVVVSLFTNMAHLDADSIRISQKIIDLQKKMRAAEDQVAKSWDEAPRETAPEQPDIASLRRGTSQPMPVKDGLSRPTVSDPPEAQLYAALNPITKFEINKSKTGVGEVGLVINQSWSPQDPEMAHLPSDQVRYLIERAESQDVELPAPNPEDFQVIATEVNPSSRSYRDDNNKEGLKENTKYFYRARAYATYTLGDETEARRHETAWTAIVSHVVKEDVEMVFRHKTLSNEYQIVITKRIQRARESAKWVGRLGQTVGDFSPAEIQNKPVREHFETKYTFHNHLKGVVKAKYIKHLVSIEVNITSHRQLPEDPTNPDVLVFDDHEETIHITISDMDGTLNDIEAVAIARANKEHEAINGVPFQRNGLIQRAIRNLAKGFKPKIYKLISFSGREVFKSGCPLHEGADHLWAVALPEDVSRKDQDWVAYYCNEAKKYYLLNVFLSENNASMVTGPHEMLNPPERQSDLPLALAAEVGNKAHLFSQADQVPEETLEFSADVIEMEEMQAISQKVDFLIVVNKDNEVLELPRGGTKTNR